MRKSSRTRRKKPRSGAGNSPSASTLPYLCYSPANSAAARPHSPKASLPASAPPPKTKSPVLPSPWFMSTAPQTPPRSTTPTFTASKPSTISRLSVSKTSSPNRLSSSSNGRSAFPCHPPGPNFASNWSTWAATPAASRSRRSARVWPGRRTVAAQHCGAPNPCKPTNSLGSAGILPAGRVFVAPELTLSPPSRRQSLPLPPPAASLEKAPRRDHGQQHFYAQRDRSGPHRTQELQHHHPHGVAGHRRGQHPPRCVPEPPFRPGLARISIRPHPPAHQRLLRGGHRAPRGQGPGPHHLSQAAHRLHAERGDPGQVSQEPRDRPALPPQSAEISNSRN